MSYCRSTSGDFAVHLEAGLSGDKPVAQERAVLEFLNGDLVKRWAETVLGL
jgi:hypothetical protein